MTSDDDLDRSISAWLMDDAPTREPELLEGPHKDRSHPASSGLANPRKVDPCVDRSRPV